MKETQWRSKLVSQFKLFNANDFIWAMDAKFKAGFPDLYLIVRGKSIHYELKMTNKVHFGSKDLEKLFDPIQISVMRSIGKAGIAARGLVHENAGNCTFIWMVDFYNERVHRFTEDSFKIFWSITDHSWAAALGS